MTRPLAIIRVISPHIFRPEYGPLAGLLGCPKALRGIASRNKGIKVVELGTIENQGETVRCDLPLRIIDDRMEAPPIRYTTINGMKELRKRTVMHKRRMRKRDKKNRRSIREENKE